MYPVIYISLNHTPEQQFILPSFVLLIYVIIVSPLAAIKKPLAPLDCSVGGKGK